MVSNYISADIISLSNQLTVDIINNLISTIPDIETKLVADDIANILQNYVENNYSTSTELSSLRPDFEGIKLQLIAILKEKDSWKDIIQAGVGETILEFVATIAQSCQMAIIRSTQDGQLDTSRLKSAVYTITRSLGVHIQRKIPSSVTVSLTCNDDNKSMRVPKFSQFSVNGLNFYNKDDIIFTEQQPTVSADLYEGTVVIESFVSSGRPYQTFEIGNDDYMVADEDVLCIDSSFVEYTRVIDGLWHYSSSDNIFYENSTPNGNVEIKFGNNSFGRIPSVGTTLNFLYASTSGAYNDTTRQSLAVSLHSVNDIVPSRIRLSSTTAEATERSRVVSAISGETISPISGGGDENTIYFYKSMAPFIRRAGGKAVSRPDHYAMALTCPTVKITDVYFRGQQELAPNNRNFINVVGITALKKDGTPLSIRERKKFEEWWESVSLWGCQYQWYDPTPVYIDVKASIKCGTGADLPRVEAFLEFKLREAMVIKRGSLGYSQYLSDIYGVLKNRYNSMQIDYVEVETPTIPTEITKLQYVVLNNVDLTVGYTNRFYKTAPIANPVEEQY